MNRYEVHLVNGRRLEVEVRHGREGWYATVDSRDYALRLVGGDGVGSLVVELDGGHFEIGLRPETAAPQAVLMGAVKVRDLPLPRPATTARNEYERPAAITSPMTGVLQSVLVKPGDIVQPGDLLVVLEAMKMENTVTASCSARVEKVAFEEGATVRTGETLITLGPVDALLPEQIDAPSGSTETLARPRAAVTPPGGNHAHRSG